MLVSFSVNLSAKLALLRIKNHEAMGSNKISGAKDFHCLSCLETGNEFKQFCVGSVAQRSSIQVITSIKSIARFLQVKFSRIIRELENIIFLLVSRSSAGLIHSGLKVDESWPKTRTPIDRSQQTKQWPKDLVQ